MHTCLENTCYTQKSPGDAGSSLSARGSPSVCLVSAPGGGQMQRWALKAQPSWGKTELSSGGTDLPGCSRPAVHCGPESPPAAGCTGCRLGPQVAQAVLRSRAGLPACLSPAPLLPSPLPKAKVKLWGRLLCVLPPAAWAPGLPKAMRQGGGWRVGVVRPTQETTALLPLTAPLLCETCRAGVSADFFFFLIFIEV